MIAELDAAEVRVLGCLVEKEITTPEYYPMTVNALVNACNQKSNREPVVAFDDELVEDTLASLREKRLVAVLTGGGNRVPKYSHRMQEQLNLGRRELALLCELMVRGPQTVGELRDRAGRMHRFSDAEEVEGCMRSLGEKEKPLVTKLPRQTGMKESRYAHLLAGEPSIVDAAPVMDAGRMDRVGALEAEVADLRDRIRTLEDQFKKFQSQFE